VWDAQAGTELHRLKGHTGAILAVAVAPDGTRIVTGSGDKTARVWNAQTGAELFQLEPNAGAVFAVAVMPDGLRVVTGSRDATSLWDLAQLRPPPARHQIATPESRQALIEHAKTVVPRCLTVEQRGAFLLGPKPPGWCIDMGKYPYDAMHWKAWKAGRDARDSATASAYGDFADAAIRAGNSDKIALEAAELGIKFDSDKIWITINRAHALMFLGRTREAREAYLAHRGETLDQGQWEKLIVDDFRSFRESHGREHELMTEIEDKFKDSLSAK
jgi:hypothetical protein